VSRCTLGDCEATNKMNPARGNKASPVKRADMNALARFNLNRTKTWLNKYGLRMDDIYFSDHLAKARTTLSPQELHWMKNRQIRANDLHYKREFLPEHMQRQNKPFEIPLIRASEAYEKKLEDTKAFY